MRSSSSTSAAPATDCYFSILPSTQEPYNSLYHSNHFSVETPTASPHYDVLSPDTLSEPSNPLLAARPSPPYTPSLSMDASKLLQLQTSAAYSTARPQTQPVQDVLDISPINLPRRSGSDSSTSSTSSERSDSASPQLTLIRCCRCHRTASLGSKSMVSFGLNSYYCSRCASIVGYGT
ncbi:hypothetical protein K490DRAFT_63357 [Saccharata proteae CBS 121410]|uniref:Uncharacterized protein n=1 Tax=Saccharata proteae CBS 121410 TaxID=1314787 RepID=A0A6A5YC22_9PEZI|nr:hypothetical protein K490DRAFT_63357 [Saccharata proteae CBS 121410]